MKLRDEEMKKWQKQQFRRYEWYAARRVLSNALVFLVFYTLIMFFAIVASSL